MKSSRMMFSDIFLKFNLSETTAFWIIMIWQTINHGESEVTRLSPVSSNPITFESSTYLSLIGFERGVI